MILLILLVYLSKVMKSTNYWGEFSGTPKVEFLSYGRQIKLLEDFIFKDRKGKEWLANKNHIVDGASIPQFFWSITEGPLDGKFRNASIIHDVGCDQKEESWQAVHLCFYEACRCGGVSECKAKMLYAAVYLFGPRWINSIPISMSAVPSIRTKEKLEKLIREKNLTLEQLRMINPEEII